jgi:phage terminase large subunit-like protein
LYGGAAGGGKSDAILMAALEYVDVPGYSALILRRDYQRLALAGAIMDRSKSWLKGTPATWNEQAKRWTFPSGATISFGYIDNPDDRYRYASSEYQFIGWDELTEFRLTDDEANPYMFLFSRLRKPKDLDVPLRIRAGSNPGNIGHAWVKRRFLTSDSATAIERCSAQLTFAAPEGRVFIPAAIRDNPALDPDEYERQLSHLPPVTRARLMRGNWDVVESLIIPAEWLRRYDARGDLLDGGTGRQIDRRQCRRFATIDTAGTGKDKADAAKGKGASWSVVAVWDYWTAADMLYLRHVWRDRVEWSGLLGAAKSTLQDWQVRSVRIENAHFGPALRSELQAAGIGDVQLVGPVLAGMADGGQGAKLDRAVASGLIKRLESGKLLIPQSAPWLANYEMELTAWQGLPDEPSDQIDVSSYAANETRRVVSGWGGTIKAGGLNK